MLDKNLDHYQDVKIAHVLEWTTESQSLNEGTTCLKLIRKYTCGSNGWEHSLMSNNQNNHSLSRKALK